MAVRRGSIARSIKKGSAHRNSTEKIVKRHSDFSISKLEKKFKLDKSSSIYGVSHIQPKNSLSKDNHQGWNENAETPVAAATVLREIDTILR